MKPSLKSVSAVAATVIAMSHIGSGDNYYAAAIGGDGADTTAGTANQCDALDVRSWRKGSERHGDEVRRYCQRAIKRLFGPFPPRIERSKRGSIELHLMA